MERTLDQSNGKIELYTFKDGLLAGIAHDLMIELTKFEIKMSTEKLSARFWLESLQVKGAIYHGILNTKELSAKDVEKIQDNMLSKVLETKKHPLAYLEYQSFEKQAQLTLKGIKKPLLLSLNPQEGFHQSLMGEIEIIPSQWGIQPFQALFGAIKLQDRMLIKWSFH
jgi:hypothetical protein